MATLSTTREQNTTANEASLLVCLPALAPEAIGTFLDTLAEAFAEVPITVALQDASAETLIVDADRCGLSQRS
jgi:hypothetical protein